MKTVRMKRNVGAFLRGQKVEVFEERRDGLYLRGMGIGLLGKHQARVIQGPVKPEDVEEER